MTSQWAIQDQNRFPALTAHTGTAGTAETVRITATNGSLNITGAVSTGAGTQAVNIIQYKGTAVGTGNPIDVNIASGGAGDGAILDGVTASIKATVFDYTSSNPLAVRLADMAGDYVAVGGGTQYQEGTAIGTVTGNVILYEDGGGTLRMPSPTNLLPVSVGGGTLGVVSSLSGGTITRVEGGTLGLVTTVSNLTNGSIVVTAGTITSITGNLPGGTLNLVSTISSLSAGTITRLEGGTVSTNMLSGTLNVGTVTATGNIAHDGVDAGNPLKVGGYASGTAPAVVSADGDRVNAWFDTTGKLAVFDGLSSLTVDGTTAVSNLAAGTVTRLEGGTLNLVSSVSNLAAGTITKLEGGTVSTNMLSGTLNLGTTVISASIPGVGATNLGKAEDAVHSSGDTGVAVWAVRNDAGTALAADGDYVPFSTDASGNLRTNATLSGTVAVSNVATGTLAVVSSITNLAGGTITKLEGGTVSTNMLSGTLNVGTVTATGNIAHDGVDAGNPLKIGGYASGTAPAAISADGDRVNAWFDATGRMAVFDGLSSLTVDGTVAVSNVATGTITSVTNLVAGTITKVEGGTISTNMLSGTLNLGTVVVSGLTAGSISLVPSAAGGWTSVLKNAQGTALGTVKATAGNFGGYYAYNPNSAVAYLQVFPITGPTLGSSVPIWSSGIPGSAAANLEISNGVIAGTAIVIACTTTATGSTAPGTGLDVNILYK